MADEQRKDDEEFEGHLSEPGVHDEPVEDDDEVEAHVQRTSNVRME
jgi:hypothetical protein